MTRLLFAIEVLELPLPDNQLKLARQIVESSLREVMDCIRLCTKDELDACKNLLDMYLLRLLRSRAPWYILPLTMAKKYSLRRTLAEVEIMLGEDYSYALVTSPRTAPGCSVALCRDGLSREEMQELLQAVIDQRRSPAEIPEGLATVRPWQNIQIPHSWLN